MPNPFIKSGQQNISDKSMTSDRPVYTDPIPERYDGSNHPYRGIEQHGVSDSVPPAEVMPEWGGTRPVEYTPRKPEPDPIPVKIVQEGGKEYKTWRTRQFSVDPGNIPRQVVASNPHRTGLRIKNMSAVTVYISKDNAVASFMGFPLVQNESLDLNIHSEVWILNPDPAVMVTIAVIEYLSLSTG